MWSIRAILLRVCLLGDVTSTLHVNERSDVIAIELYCGEDGGLGLNIQNISQRKDIAMNFNVTTQLFVPHQ